MYRDYLRGLHSQHPPRGGSAPPTLVRGDTRLRGGRALTSACASERGDASNIVEKNAGHSAKSTSRMVRKVSFWDEKSGHGNTKVRFQTEESTIWKLLHGDVSVECPSTARIVRIFTSSTFTDTRHERNALMERVYPALKEVCQQQGYEFQVVDMRWGIRDEATDDHMATELCLREVDLCKRLSTGPYFVTFLSHKYGYRKVPSKIEACEYEMLSADMDLETKTLLETWFKKDDNAVPPTYIMQPISKVIPDFNSKDELTRKAARDTWFYQNSKLHTALIKAANQKLDMASARRYSMSVTETEINKGIMEADSKPNKCLWFQRVIEDIDSQPTSFLVSRYKDCLGDEDKVKESRELLEDLKNKRLPKVLAAEHHTTYTVRWSAKGIDPENTDHARYIETLCKDFKHKVSAMILRSIEEKKQSNLDHPLVKEVVEHTVFCQAKCKAFRGRQESLDLVSKYLTGSSTKPFVIYGPSGCGKTSIVAMTTVTCALRTSRHPPAIIMRFIGTTPASSSIGPLLASITSQIWRIYDRDVKELPTDVKELTELFHASLKMASPQKHLVVLLDSLDQFDSGQGAKQLSWLPRDLPENVKMILSTLPEKQYECFPILQGLYRVQENFLEVPKPANHEVSGILENWLEINNRKLLGNQMKVILDAFEECPLLLFLKLSFDEACRWSSFSEEDETRLQTTVRGSINALFSRMEKLHGHIFVSRTLAYLTLSKSGLTESELEDILSCDDDVLNDVYMYWIPPVRRLPPLLLVRLKADLGQYLVDRGADGVRVFYWYHRQFIEAATDKYCSDQQTNERVHASLAEFFSGTWANGTEKPFSYQNGEAFSADRKVSPQPLRFKNGFNLRKLNNFPYHRTEAKQLNHLKSECLLKFEFLQDKLQGSGLRPLLNDFLRARNTFPGDEDIKTIGECLQLSQDAVSTFPKELPSHFLARIRNKPSLKQFLEDCTQTHYKFLLPDKPILTSPGGQLIHCLADHKGSLRGIDMTKDGRFAVTSSNDKSVKIWDVVTGSLVRSIDKIGEYPTKPLLCCQDSLLLVRTEECLHAFDLHSGVRVYKVQFEDFKGSYCIGGKDKNIICKFSPSSVVLYSAVDGELLEEIECDILEEDQQISFHGTCIGSTNYAAVLDDRNVNLLIFDIDARRFIHNTCIKPNVNIETMVFNHSGDKLYVGIFSKNNYIYVFDTKTLEKEKVTQGDDTCVSCQFRMTSDEMNLYFAKSGKVVVVDLQTDKRRSILRQQSNLIDVVIMNMEMAAGISLDHVVRIWDLTRQLPEEEDLDQDLTLFLDEPDEKGLQSVKEEQRPVTEGRTKEKIRIEDRGEKRMTEGHEKKRTEGHEEKRMTEGNSQEKMVPDGHEEKRMTEGHTKQRSMTDDHIKEKRITEEGKKMSTKSMGTAERKMRKMKSRMFKLRINGLKTFANARYILVLMSYSADHFIQIRDLSLDKVVRHIRMDVAPSRIRPLGDSIHVILDVNRHLKKLNLITGDVMTFQGTLPHSVDSVFILDGREIATASLDRIHIKLYSVETGTLACTLKAGNEQQIDDIRANIKGTLVVAGTDEGPAYVYDVAARNCLYTITSGQLGLKDSISIRNALLTSDDAYLILQGSKVPARAYLDDNEEYILLSWDLKNKCLKKELVDYEMYRKYADSDDNEADTGVDVFKLLDDRTVVSNHNDAYIRVFDIITGALLKRVQGHQSCRLATVPTSPYFLSQGMYRRDNNFRLYNKITWEIMATFSPDIKMKYVSLTADGNHVVGHFWEYNKSVVWNIIGGSEPTLSIPFESFPNIYGIETVKMNLVLDDTEDDDNYLEDPDTDSDDQKDV